MSYVSGAPHAIHRITINTKTTRYTATKLTHIYTETNERNAMVLYMIKQNRGTVLGLYQTSPSGLWVEEGVRGLCSCEVILLCGEFEGGGIVQGTVEVVELLALRSLLGAT